MKDGLNLSPCIASPLLSRATAIVVAMTKEEASCRRRRRPNQEKEDTNGRRCELYALRIVAEREWVSRCLIPHPWAIRDPFS